MYNGHADVTVLLGANDTVLVSYYYDAFGNITETTGTYDNPYRYSGYRYDEETKNYYLTARYYNPAIARLLQEDTYRGDPNDPLSLNLYTYCANNPIIYKDPSGHRHMTDGTSGKYHPTVENLYNLDAKQYAPVQVSTKDNTVYIDIYAKFTGDASDEFKNSGGMTYADVAEKGIEDRWTTSLQGSNYDFVNGMQIDVVTRVHSFIPGAPRVAQHGQLDEPEEIFDSKQGFIEINIDNQNIGISHQKDSTFGSIIGDFFTGDWSFSNWSTDNVDNITLYNSYDGGPKYNQRDYEYVAAHEVGHILGLGDAYNGGFLGLRKAATVTSEVPGDDIMLSFGGKVNANDIEMVLEAFATNQYQSFTDQKFRVPRSRVIRDK